jgi:hypothetical protein
MIKGLTDHVRVSWDGKIRGGYKPDENSAPVNTPYFLLHDAPGLAETLGEKPTEFFTTFLYDDPEAVMKMDLRWYKQNSLVCQGNGEVAAFYENGDFAGVRQQQATFRERDFLGKETVRVIPKSRERVCGYKNCPEYVTQKCKQHAFLTFTIPQHSMAGIYTMESVSQYTHNSMLAERERAIRHNAVLGKPFKISGEIFRVYKSKEPVAFMNVKTGKKSESEKDVTLIEWIPFHKYEEAFRGKITDSNWEFLLAIRQAGLRLPGQEFSQPDLANTAQLNGPGAQAVLPAPSSNALTATEDQQKADLEALKARANHESVLPLFKQLSELKKNVANTEENRIKTARQFPDVIGLAQYLTAAIKKLKKEDPAPEAPNTSSAPVPTAGPSQPAAGQNLFQ